MKHGWIAPVAAVAIAAGFSLSGAQAAPAGAAAGMQRAAAEGDLVEKVHGGHRSCEWGVNLGWHRHVGIAARPVWCRPLAPQPFRCWVDYWGVRHCNW
jgi:hypothetical protein